MTCVSGRSAADQPGTFTAQQTCTLHAGDRAGTVREWDLRIVREPTAPDRAKQIVFAALVSPIDFLAVTPSGHFAAVGSKTSHNAYVCDLTTGTAKQVDVELSCRGVAGLPGDKFAVATLDAIHIINASTGAKLHAFREHLGGVIAIASNNRGLLVSVGEDKNVKQYDTAKMQCSSSTELNLTSSSVKTLCPAGEAVAAFFADGSVEYFGEGAMVGTCIPDAHGGKVPTASCVYQGEYLLTGADGEIKMWDAKKGPIECVNTTGDQDGAIVSLVELPDGKVVSASGSKLHLWANSLV